MRVLLGVFLILHGLVHVALYTLPPEARRPMPFDPGHSWLLGLAHVGSTPMRSASTAIALVAAAAYPASGWLLLLDSGGWSSALVIAAVAGLLLKTVWFTPWLSAGLAIDVVLLASTAL